MTRTTATAHPARRAAAAACAAAAALSACGGGDAPETAQPFSVVFGNCAEYVGVTLVPSAGVLPLVPGDFIAAEDAPPSVPVAQRNTFFVMRTARCEQTAIDGGAARPTTLAQIGVAALRPVDSSASENGYSVLFAYVTDNAELADRMRAFGLPVEVDPALSQTFTAAGAASGSYAASVTSQRLGNFTLQGTVTPPSANTPPIVVPFVADWYVAASADVRMRTTFPAIAIGAPAPGGPPTVTVGATPGSTLAGWLGAPGGAFFIGSVFNTWDTATMSVGYAP